MVYSLVSAPVLGFDIVRLPGGAAVAELLRRSLTLQPEELEPLARRLPPAEVRERLWAEVEQAAPRQVRVRDLAGGSAVPPVEALQRAPIGNLDGLLHCLRHDVLEWSWQRSGDSWAQSDTAARATAVLADAAVSAYLREQLPDQVRRQLAAGWVGAARELPDRHSDFGPHHAEVETLLERVAALSAGSAGLRQLVALTETMRAGDSWSQWAHAMHSVSWAVHLSGRLRPAAAAQFALVQAVDAAQLSVSERAGGAWNLLSGAVHALVMRDMVATDQARLLLAPHRALFAIPEPR